MSTILFFRRLFHCTQETGQQVFQSPSLTETGSTNMTHWSLSLSLRPLSPHPPPLPLHFSLWYSKYRDAEK